MSTNWAVTDIHLVPSVMSTATFTLIEKQYFTAEVSIIVGVLKLLPTCRQVRVEIKIRHKVSRLYPVGFVDSGAGTNVIQNIHKLRVRQCDRTHKSSGHCGTGAHNSQKFRVGKKMLCPYPGYCGKGVHNLQEFFVE